MRTYCFAKPNFISAAQLVRSANRSFADGDNSYYDYDYDYNDPYIDDSGDYYADADQYGYGYNDLYDQDDWFYDYYDDGYSYYSDFDDDGLYDYNYRYYDWDDDGFYDAYSTYSDWDDDGIFEDYNYYSLNDVGSSSENQQQAQQQSSRDGTDQRIAGEVLQVKRVSTWDTKNLLVQIERQDGLSTDGGKRMLVDLGPAGKLDTNLSEGDQVTIRGPIAKVQDQKVVLAQSLIRNGKEFEIDRRQQPADCNS